MPNTTTVIIGAGHCGLAMSHCLAARSIDHVVLERGEVANSWRTQRWDSLRLLTPNWMTRLPGYAYRGADPDGYLSARQVTAMLEDYAEASVVPVLTGRCSGTCGSKIMWRKRPMRSFWYPIGVQILRVGQILHAHPGALAPGRFSERQGAGSLGRWS